MENLSFLSTNPYGWSWTETGIFAVIVLVAQSILPYVVLSFGIIAPRLATKESVKPLQEFELVDYACICFSKCITVVFAYNVDCFIWTSPNVSWKASELTLQNTLFAYIALYVIYDFFYTLFHRLLHVRGLYKYIHKHHHRQMVPFRGTPDAINVHPIEFTTGEYLHLFCLYCVPTHVYTVLLFVISDGIFASLNHTRYNITIPGIFTTKAHDTHHHLPNWNFGQYTSYWDKLFGTYRAHWMDGGKIDGIGKEE